MHFIKKYTLKMYVIKLTTRLTCFLLNYYMNIQLSCFSSKVEQDNKNTSVT